MQHTIMIYDLSICNDVLENKEFCKNKASLFKATACGNGDLDSGEDCDDNNKINCDGCSADCKKEIGYICGDGIVNADCGEECDGSDNKLCPGKCKSNCKCGIILPTWIEFVKEFDGSDCGVKLESGWNLEVDNLGNLYVSDGGGDVVKKFNSDGTCINETKNIEYANSIAIDSNNKKYIFYEAGNDKNILQLNKDDKEELKWNIGSNIERIFVINDKMYILHSSGKTIFKYSLDRKPEATYTVEFTQDIDYDSKNNRIIAAGYGKITAYNLNFKKIKDMISLPAALPSGYRRNYHIAVHNGDIYVSDEKGNKLIILDENGNELGVIGKINDEYGNGQGEFSLPRDISIKNYYLYVADSYNHRIQKFKINPR